MVEVTNINFNSILNDFEHDIKKCTFFAIDYEFTALPSDIGFENNFFESPEDRYIEIKESIEKCLIIQIGITPFRHNRDLNHFRAKTYNFYVFPRRFGHFNAPMLSTPSTVKFLCDSKFDFNKVFYGGIHYLNKTHRDKLLQKLIDGTLLNLVKENFEHDESEHDSFYDVYDAIGPWFTISDGKPYELPYAIKDPELNYLIKEEVREFSKTVWCICENNKIIVTRVNPEERRQLEKKEQTREVHEIFLDSLKGFSKIYDILSSSKKPLVGHNIFLDLVTSYNHFHEDLPASYSEFKKNLNCLFPHIYDTKHIVQELRYIKKKDFKFTSLIDVYNDYQDNGNVSHFPKVVMDPKGIYESVDKQHAHNAGWDSYMTGFIFLKMADEFLRLNRKEQNLINIMPTELIDCLENMKNKIRIARCKAPFMNIAGDDPISRRPPILHVSHHEKQLLGTLELDDAFKKYEPLSKKRLNLYSALIATPNFKCFKRILLDFHNSKEFKVEKYSPVPVRHHRGSRLLIAAGLFVPVVITIWLGVKKYLTQRKT